MISDEPFALVPFLLVGSVMLIAIVIRVVAITLLFSVCAPSHLWSVLCPFRWWSVSVPPVHWWSMSVPLTLVVLEQIKMYHIQDLTVLYCLAAQWWTVCIPPCFSVGPLSLAVSGGSYTHRIIGKHWQRRKWRVLKCKHKNKI